MEIRNKSFYKLSHIKNNNKLQGYTVQHSEYSQYFITTSRI